jgi:hypothetical protein
MVSRRGFLCYRNSVLIRTPSGTTDLEVDKNFPLLGYYTSCTDGNPEDCSSRESSCYVLLFRTMPKEISHRAFNLEVWVSSRKSGFHRGGLGFITFIPCEK